MTATINYDCKFSRISPNVTKPENLYLPHPVLYGINFNTSYHANLTIGEYSSFGWLINDRFVNNVSDICPNTLYRIEKVISLNTNSSISSG